MNYRNTVVIIILKQSSTVFWSCDYWHIAIV